MVHDNPNSFHCCFLGLGEGDKHLVYGHPNIFHYFPIILGEGDTHLVHDRLNFLGYRILGEGVGEVVYIASTIGMFVVAGLFRDSCVWYVSALGNLYSGSFSGIYSWPST